MGNLFNKYFEEVERTIKTNTDPSVVDTKSLTAFGDLWYRHASKFNFTTDKSDLFKEVVLTGLTVDSVMGGHADAFVRSVHWLH